MPHLAQAGHCLGPAEGLLDAFADALRDRIAGMTGGALVDRRAAAIGVLRNVRGDCLVAQCHHKLGTVIAPRLRGGRLLSAPSVTGRGVAACGSISVSAA